MGSVFKPNLSDSTASVCNTVLHVLMTSDPYSNLRVLLSVVISVVFVGLLFLSGWFVFTGEGRRNRLSLRL